MLFWLNASEVVIYVSLGVSTDLHDVALNIYVMIDVTGFIESYRSILVSFSMIAALMIWQ